MCSKHRFYEIKKMGTHWHNKVISAKKNLACATRNNLYLTVSELLILAFFVKEQKMQSCYRQEFNTVSMSTKWEVSKLRKQTEDQNILKKQR